jgi:hypothetical protein
MLRIFAVASFVAVALAGCVGASSSAGEAAARTTSHTEASPSDSATPRTARSLSAADTSACAGATAAQDKIDELVSEIVGGRRTTVLDVEPVFKSAADKQEVLATAAQDEKVRRTIMALRHANRLVARKAHTYIYRTGRLDITAEVEAADQAKSKMLNACSP